MFDIVTTEMEKSLYPGTVVTLADEVASIQSVEGKRIPASEAGPGVVRSTADNDKVLVWWSKAGIETWLDPADLRPIEAIAHLVTVYDCTDRPGQNTRRLVRNMVVTTAGLQHNWVVEVHEEAVVRAIREDNQVWTFDWNPLMRRVSTIHTLWFQPPGDDDAEALTVAEMAML